MRTAHMDLAQRPFIVIWEATRACALACLHCRAEAIPQRSPWELTTQQACDLMDDVRSVGQPPPFFVITGGDPFMRPDLYELVAHGAGIGLPVAVSPSGTPALNEPNLRRLREAGASAISLSIDGADAPTHDGFRGVEGSFNLTLAGWARAKELGLRVQINTAVTPSNFRQLPDLLALIHSRGALTWSLFFLVPTGRGTHLPQLRAQQTEDVLHFCYDANRIVSVKTTEAPAFRRVSFQRRILADRGIPLKGAGLTGVEYDYLVQRMRELGLPENDEGPRRPPLPISAGRGFAFVSHTGQVYPSGFLPVSAGNVQDRPLTSIYRDSTLFRQLRDPDAPTDRCGACEFRRVCGGSRPRAFGATGDLLGDDPLCAYQPGSFGFADDIERLLPVAS